MSRDTRVIHNPLLALPAISELQGLPAASRAALRAVMLDLARDASDRAEACWQRHKGPMAAYWKAVAVYAKHTARALVCHPDHKQVPGSQTK